MARHLRIEINGIEWVNGEYDEIGFVDGPGGIRVEGKLANKGGGGGGLMDLLAGASRSRTEAIAKEKKAALSGFGGGVGDSDSP